jgi:uncharacterized repeat protein (TIGR03803 family)
VLDEQGRVYGTTFSGGNESCKTNYSLGCGTLFILKPAKLKSEWTERQVHVFSGGQDGAMPNGQLGIGKDGSLYGGAFQGGTQDFGMVFQFSLGKGQHWTEQALHNFLGREGRNPVAGIILGGPGVVYGSASGGGKDAGGTAFELVKTKTGWNFTLTHQFTAQPDGWSPLSLIRDTNGNLFGTTLYGGRGGTSCGSNGCGTVFEVSP